MWNLCEIFSENAEKAKLITALLSVIAAVLVVYFTHALAQRRSKIELRVKKMEELYSAVMEFTAAGYKFIHELANPSGSAIDSHSSYYEELRKVEMLCAIYCKELLPQINKFNQIVLLVKTDGTENLSEFPNKIEQCVKIQQYIQEKIANKARKIV